MANVSEDPKFTLKQGSLPKSKIDEIRERIEARKEESSDVQVEFTPPEYDDIYWEGMDSLNNT